MSVAFHESEFLSVLVYSPVYCGPSQTPPERTNSLSLNSSVAFEMVGLPGEKKNKIPQ